MRRTFLLALMAGLLFACDSADRSSDRGAEAEENTTVAPADAEEGASIHTDSTTSGGLNRQNPYDTLE